MKVKRIILLLIISFSLMGCTNINRLSYDDIVNDINKNINKVNTYRKGYSYYIPKGLYMKKAGPNYAILEGDSINYYVYFDIISYNSNKELTHSFKENSVYKKDLNNGYVEIILNDNNEYLIEIMYNYAKIEVMVDNDKYINKILINSISVLNSVKYDSVVIKNMLNDDSLDYTEEVFDLFKERNKNTDLLDYIESSYEDEDDEIIDTDFID